VIFLSDTFTFQTVFDDHMLHSITSDSTGTVSGTVSARNSVGSVRSRNIVCSGVGTCDLPYTKLVCSPWGKVGSSKGESENSR